MQINFFLVLLKLYIVGYNEKEAVKFPSHSISYTMSLVKFGETDNSAYEIKTEKDIEDTNKGSANKFFCTFCGFAAKMHITLQRHVEMNHIALRFQCAICEYSTKGKIYCKKSRQITT